MATSAAAQHLETKAIGCAYCRICDCKSQQLPGCTAAPSSGGGKFERWKRRGSQKRAGISSALISSAFPANGDICTQGLKLFARRALGRALDLPIPGYQRLTKRSQHGAAAVLAAGLPLDRGLLADAIDFIDQIPCPLVGHVHGPPGRGNRTAAVDVFEQQDFARTDPSLRIEIDPNAERWQR